MLLSPYTSSQRSQTWCKALLSADSLPISHRQSESGRESQGVFFGQGPFTCLREWLQRPACIGITTLLSYILYIICIHQVHYSIRSGDVTISRSVIHLKVLVSVLVEVTLNLGLSAGLDPV